MNKQCPICGEYIPVESTVCEFCGENIEKRNNTDKAAQVEDNIENNIENQSDSNIKEVSPKEQKTVKKYFFPLIVTISVILLSVLMFALLYKYEKSTDTTIYTTNENNEQQEQIIDKEENSNKEIEEAKQFFKEKKYEQAAIIFEREIENSQNPIAYFYLGRIYQEQNYTDLAIEKFKKAIEIKTNFFEPLLELTKIYYQKQDYSLALDYGTNALKIKNNNKELLELLLNIYTDKDDDLNKIFEISQLLVKVEPNNLDANIGTGMYYYQKDNFKSAIIYLRKALDIEYNRNVSLLLAKSYIAQEQYTNAINVLDKILSNDYYDYEANNLKQDAMYQRNVYLQRKNQMQQNSNQNESEDLLFN